MPPKRNLRIIISNLLALTNTAAAQPVPPSLHGLSVLRVPHPRVILRCTIGTP